MRVSDWVRESPTASFQSWTSEIHKRTDELSSMDKEEVHRYRLMEKYARIWRVHTKKGEWGLQLDGGCFTPGSV